MLPTSVRDLPLRLLSPENRPAKISLWRRAEECAVQMREASKRHPFDPETFCRASNRGALAMAMAGDMEESERSCRRQARILLASTRSGDLPAAELPRVLQPWINIGRLRILQGRWEEALTHFPSPRTLHEAGVFEGWLGPEAGLTGDEADRILDSPEGRNFMTNTHVVETIKAYARGDRADLMAEHVDAWWEHAEGVPHLREAAALLTLRGGGSLPSATTEASPTPAQMAIEVHAATADESRSTSLDERLGLLAALEPRADLVPVLRAGADLLAARGRCSEAARILRRTADVCRTVEDEADLFSVLTDLARLEPDSGADRESRTVASGSAYAFVRARTGQDPLPPVADESRLAVLVDSEVEAETRLTPSSEST